MPQLLKDAILEAPVFHCIHRVKFSIIVLNLQVKG